MLTEQDKTRMRFSDLSHGGYFLNAQLRIIAFNKQFDSIITISDNALLWIDLGAFVEDHHRVKLKRTNYSMRLTGNEVDLSARF